MRFSHHYSSVVLKLRRETSWQCGWKERWWTFSFHCHLSSSCTQYIPQPGSEFQTHFHLNGLHLVRSHQAAMSHTESNLGSGA